MVATSKSDVICLQEIKATEDQIPVEAITNAGYPYQYYYSATKGIQRCSNFVKIKPNHVAYGTGIDHMDFEGRNLRADL
jgi:exodeoxyribonuclease-3